MKQKYTKGPWEFKKQKNSNGIEHDCIYGTVESQSGLCFEVAAIWGDVEEDEPTANAQLIAAAPDLLEALQMLLNVDELDHAAVFKAQQKATLAIDKAIGNEFY